MSNLNEKKVRSKKLSTRVDLTAMVSISFLLIIFFMVTIELAKPKAMDLSLPEKYDEEKWGHVIQCGLGADERLITILLGENDKIVTYSGILFYQDENPKILDYGKNGIRKELSIKNKIIREYSAKIGRRKNGPIVIIKPSKKCNYKNLVDILDEMKIAKIDTYAIVDEYTAEETKLLASK